MCYTVCSNYTDRVLKQTKGDFMPEKKSNRGKGPSPTTKMILFGKTGGRRKKLCQR